MAKELIRTRVNCTAAKGADGRLSGFTSADAHAGLAVALDGDNNNEVNAEPHVKKTAAAADEIYGILEGPTRGTEKLSVIPMVSFVLGNRLRLQPRTLVVVLSAMLLGKSILLPIQGVTQKVKV